MAFQRGEDTIDAQLGAYMHADFQAAVVTFIESYVKANQKRPKQPKRRRR